MENVEKKPFGQSTAHPLTVGAKFVAAVCARLFDKFCFVHRLSWNCRKNVGIYIFFCKRRGASQGTRGRAAVVAAARESTT